MLICSFFKPFDKDVLKVVLLNIHFIKTKSKIHWRSTLMDSCIIPSVLMGKLALLTTHPFISLFPFPILHRSDELDSFPSSFISFLLPSFTLWIVVYVTINFFCSCLNYLAHWFIAVVDRLGCCFNQWWVVVLMSKNAASTIKLTLLLLFLQMTHRYTVRACVYACVCVYCAYQVVLLYEMRFQ